MKKTTLLAVSALALLSAAACSDHKADTTAPRNGKTTAYTGVLPAADCDGVRYTLILDYDDEGNGGDYTLVETYLQADTLSALGYADLKSFTGEGDFTVGKQGDKTYLTLTQDGAGASDTPIYYLVDTGNSITMTNSGLEVFSAPGMNYTLTAAE